YRRRHEQPPGAARREAVAHFLETEVLPVSKALLAFNTRQIDESEEAHRRTVAWMAWGLGVVGGIGGVAGVFLGYGVARGLRHSIYQLSVRIRDAAGRLGPDLPTVTLAQDADFETLHAQLHGLVQDIEKVVRQL